MNKKEYRITKISEFLKLPHNKWITVNNCKCKIISNMYVVYNVLIKTKDDTTPFHIEYAFKYLGIERKYIPIEKISELKNIDFEKSYDNLYYYTYEDYGFMVYIDFYRLLDNLDYLGNLNTDIIVCNIKVESEYYDKDSGFVFGKTEQNFFINDNNSMIDFEELTSCIKETSECEVIENLIEKIAKVFKRKITISKNGIPYKILG